MRAGMAVYVAVYKINGLPDSYSYPVFPGETEPRFCSVGLDTDGSTMIVVTHEMEFARNVADKVIFMADGCIEEAGTPDEVFGNPKSERLKAFLSKAMD